MQRREMRGSGRATRAPQTAVAASKVPAQPKPEWMQHLWRVLLVLAVVFAAWSNCFRSGLVFDNAFIIGDDPRIRAATFENLKQIFTTGYWHANAGLGLYRPLTTLTYLLNYAIFGNGLEPGGYHWINLALHGINVVLVYAVGLLVFRRLGQAGVDQAGLNQAWALAAIWGLHPVLTESVTNIVGRADLLAAFGVLAGLLCYVQGITAKGGKRIGWFAALVVAQAVGLFSKESAAVLLAILLLYDIVFPRSGTWRERFPAWAALALPFAAFLFLRSGIDTHIHIAFVDNPLIAAGLFAGRVTAIQVIGKLAWLFVWPLRLSADYSYNAIPVFGSGGAADYAKTILAAFFFAPEQLQLRLSGVPDNGQFHSSSDYFLLRSCRPRTLSF